MSFAYLVSFADPYNSPNTPHQYHCLTMFLMVVVYILFPSISTVQIAARGISCVVYGKSLLEKIRSSCSSLSATEKPLQRSSAYFLYVDNCSASTSFFLQLTVPPDSNEDSNVNAVKKSVAVTMFSSSPEKYFSLRSSQS